MAYLQMKWQLTNDLRAIIKELAPAAALFWRPGQQFFRAVLDKFLAFGPVPCFLPAIFVLAVSFCACSTLA
jgi:hypothetical protein